MPVVTAIGRKFIEFEHHDLLLVSGLISNDVSITLLFHCHFIIPVILFVIAGAPVAVVAGR
jgi:hypothetical protein